MNTGTNPAPILTAESLAAIDARANAIMPHADTPGGHFRKAGAADHIGGIYHEDGGTYYVRVPAALRDSFLAVLENWPLVLTSHRALSAEVARLADAARILIDESENGGLECLSIEAKSALDEARLALAPGAKGEGGDA